ncbi:Speckle-type POZ protein-like B [Araneus ventricosus]|uniref:Speckle-type POZ protein-like B n=1 Tax=Araneus ventricosus TaxID=182803 RepID=A0A4Y2K0Z9_ARAVE|nr:Speckle-type POZ protein-like B [Araneus ventricosus]
MPASGNACARKGRSETWQFAKNKFWSDFIRFCSGRSAITWCFGLEQRSLVKSSCAFASSETPKPGEMQQFPINWSFGVHSVTVGKISELRLSNGVTVSCSWTGNNSSISGEECGRVKRKILKVMQPRSSSLEISFDDMKDPIFFCSLNYSLKGVLNIFSISDICANGFKNGEFWKSVHLQSLAELSNELESLLDPETCCFADVNLKCGNASIPAHKNILSARSPVFAAMFKNPMKENHENEVDISDMDVSVVRIMLTYIYTGKTLDLTVSSASGLLHAADKYQLLDLKRVCCDFLKDNMSLQNVFFILALGDLYCEDLKSCAVDYMRNKCIRFSVLEETEEWKALREERPALAMDVLMFLMRSRDKKLKKYVSACSPTWPPTLHHRRTWSE